MELRDADQNVIDKNPTAETLIIGPESVDLHLNTKSEIDCVHCYDDAFFGLPLDQVRFWHKSAIFFYFKFPKILLIIFMTFSSCIPMLLQKYGMILAILLM